MWAMRRCGGAARDSHARFCLDEGGGLKLNSMQTVASEREGSGPGDAGTAERDVPSYPWPLRGIWRGVGPSWKRVLSCLSSDFHGQWFWFGGQCAAKTRLLPEAEAESESDCQTVRL